jgi:hypothetical protein
LEFVSEAQAFPRQFLPRVETIGGLPEWFGDENARKYVRKMGIRNREPKFGAQVALWSFADTVSVIVNSGIEKRQRLWHGHF